MAPSITIAVVGEQMLDPPIVNGGRSPGSAHVFEVLHGADLVFVNLECPLTTRGAPADKHVDLRGDPALAHELRAAGVDVATVANNHLFDYGVEGMYDTLGALRAAGVAAVGAGADLAASLAPAVLTARGARVAFVGLSTTLPVGSGASDERPGMAPVRVTTSYVIDSAALDETPGAAPIVETRCWPEDVAAAAAAVTAAKRAADLCVVGIHWGVPNGWVAQFQEPVAMYQRPLAEALVGAGADMIVGHHPHVLHAIDMINGRPVFYSLGNFMFHSVVVGRLPKLRRTDPPYSWRSLRAPVTRDSVVALVTCGAGAVQKIDLVPVMMNSVGDPELATGAGAARILTNLDALCEPYGIRVIADGSRGRVDTATVSARS
jgi:poly-gamma-glutamate synthesis protein (capsule biosynthesis protein)